MSLKDQLRADLASAMREGDPFKRDTLRMLVAAIKQEEVDRQVNLHDEGVSMVLSKQAKQRRESIEDARRAGRDDLVENEMAELALIESYLPEMLGPEEIEQEASQVIAETGATGIKDMGRVMGQLMPRLQGKADGKLVSKIVRELLQS
ncbi:MAG: GatB/YqeY domain-containing protein [Candidatus Promineifilaceae bacterium]|nr:GatB/YqeY domain-containing protein [Candidatus Promineifilaceae bacterium]